MACLYHFQPTKEGMYEEQNIKPFKKMNTQVNNPFTGNTPPGDNKPGIFIHETDYIK